MERSSKLVSLSSGVSFACDDQQSILEAARNAGVVLEHSCRTGRCGVCAARVLMGETKAIQTEASLSSQQKISGHILTCCRTASTDVKLDIEDLGGLAELKPITIPARIDSINLLAKDVIQITLRIPPLTNFKFRAGQYVDVIGPQAVRRSYSLANAPRDDSKLKLEIKKVEGGLLSEYWFKRAEVNDLLRLEGPLGTFCLRPTDKRNLIFLATGTGIAPVKAMLEELDASPRCTAQNFDRISLYWGGRVERDLYWRPEFQNLCLEYMPTLSQSINWGGRTGYVHQEVLKDNVDLNNSVVYACGSENMIKSARNVLTRAGLGISDFYSDAFVSSS